MPRFFLLTYNRIVRGETVEGTALVPETEVAGEINRLLERGAFNINPTLDVNPDEEIEAELEAMLSTGDFSKLDAIS